MEFLKIFGTKVSYFTTLYELTKMNLFFHLSVRLAEVLSMGLSDQYNLFVDRFRISLMAVELFLLNQENPYVLFN